MFKNRMLNLSPIVFFAIILFLIFNASYSVKAQNTLDPSFTGGVTDASANGYVSAVQPDGKILVGGSYQFVNGTQRGYFTRLNADGTIDSSFNAGGSGADGDVLEIIVLADGKILIGGSFTSYNGTPMSRVARLNADGTLDNTFVTGTGVTGGRLTSIQVQPDGKIIIAGQSVSGYNGVTSNGLSRLNPDGSFDNTFVSGFTTSPSIEQIVLQTDGKILIGGFFSSYGGTAVTGFLRVNANGTRDTTFNAGGSGLSEFNAVAGLAIQTDGKILIGGDFTSYNGTARKFIARINADGTLDTSFVPPTFFDGDGFVESFAIQSDGKILAAGALPSGLAGSVLTAIRMNADGSADNSFSILTDSFGYDITLQPDGKAVLTGFFTQINSSQTRNAVARINSNGTIDNAFSPSFTKNGLINAITQQADGKILVGGEFQRANGVLKDKVVRFNADGTLDTNFVLDSGIFPNQRNFTNSVKAIATQTDGKILVGGDFGGLSTNPQPALVRLNANGSSDSFGISGDIDLNLIPSVETIVVLPDGKILIGGRFFTTGGQVRGLLRLNTNGSIDTTFNAGNATANNVVYRINRQADGKLIIVGAFTNYSGTSRNRIARLNADGTLDTSFNPGTGANNIVYDAAIQLDGKILISGAFTTINGITQNRIARLNTDGSLDTSFNSGTGADNLVYSLTILPTGKIAIGGTFAVYNGISKNRLARLNADGSLDASFNSGVEGIPSFVRRVVTKIDGKLLIGGTFNAYSGIPRNNLAQLFTPEVTGGNQPLLFTTNRDGNNEIYRMNADGTNQQRLTNTPESEFSGFWSPDGQKIAFSRIISTNVRQIWTMNADGTNKVNISGTNAFDVVYRYSPNGQKILFTRSTAVNQSSIWVMNPDGSNKVRLTNDANFVDLRPEWSPNGTQISFSRCTPVTFICDIYTMNADGSNQTNRTASFTDDDDLSRWSADGKIIFIRGGTASGFRDIFSMNPDGTNVQRLTTTAIPTFTADLIVSPTINKMMFVRAQEGPVESHEIYTMNTDGSNTLNLTNNSLYDGISAWSPDSSKIAFISRREAVLNEIYTMNSDGSSPVRLTFNNANDFVTDWFRPTAPVRTAFDYDGDGKADVSVFRPSNGNWYLNRSANGFAATAFGVASDKIVPADYDGDGKTDLAVFRDGNWYYLKSSDGAFAAVSFGQAGDLPVSGDFDGDGRSDQAVFRNGIWYLNRSTLGFAFVQFGVATDKPVAADYDGDGRADIAVYRDGNWYSLRSSDGQFAAISFGVGTDLAVPADYDGDGRADQAVYRSGVWYLNRSTLGFAGIAFGVATDIPAAADYDGDGRADTAVYRDGNWYILQSTAGFTAQFFGQSGDKPTPSALLP